MHAVSLPIIVYVMPVTFTELKNDTLRLARQVWRGAPSKMKGAETPEFVVFIFPLHCRVDDANTQRMSLRKADREIVEHSTDINVTLLTFGKGAR